jgi:hypothetical protein
MIDRPDYMSEEEWQEYLRKRKPKERKAKAGPNGEDDFIRGAEGQILKGNPRNIRLAVHKLGASFKQNDFAGRTEVSGLPNFGPELTDPGAIRLRLCVGRDRAEKPH